MRSAHYRFISKPLAPALGVLVALGLYPSIWPPAYLPVAALVAALVAYAAFSPTQTARAFGSAWMKTFGTLPRKPYLGLRVSTLLLCSLIAPAYAMTGLMAVLFEAISIAEGKSTFGTLHVPMGILLLHITWSGFFGLFVIGGLRTELVNKVKERDPRDWHYREPVKHPIRDFWLIHLYLLPLVCQVLALIYAAQWSWIDGRRLAGIWRGRITRFAILFIRAIHSSQRKIMAIDAGIGLIISFFLYIKMWQLERVDYLIYGALTGYVVGFVHNSLVLLVKHLNKRHWHMNLNILGLG